MRRSLPEGTWRSAFFFSRDDDDGDDGGDATGVRVGWMGASIIWCREFFLKKISKSSDRRRDDRTATRRDATDGCDAYPRDGLGMVMIACVTDGVLLRRDAT